MRRRILAAMGGGLSAKDYICDYAQFDAKENGGYGVFNASATSWTDCKGSVSGVNLIASTPNWQDNYYKFNGSDYFDCEDSGIQDLLNTKNFTIEIVVRAFVGTSNGGILCIGRYTNRNFWMWERNNTRNPSDPYIDDIQTQFGNFGRPKGAYNAWHTYAFTCSSSAIKFYEDGVLLSTQTPLNTTRKNEGFYFGWLGTKYGYSQSGLSSYRFSSTALTAERLDYNRAIDIKRFGIT